MMEVEVENAHSRRLISDAASSGSPSHKGATDDTAYARANEVWSENAQGNIVSITGCARQEKMPNAWRGSGQRSSFR
jgi:hypothetical protein